MRIAVASLNYLLGDFDGNFEKIAQVIKKLEKQADLVIFSELCLSGYYPKDLINHPYFFAHQNLILEKIVALSLQYQIAIIIGYVAKNEGKGKPYHNSLGLFNNGKQEYLYHKRLLPVYDIFDEARHFAPGKEPGIFRFKGIRFGFLICEDGWAGLNNFLYEFDPVDDLTNNKTDIIICINGSPSNVGKQEDRIKHFSAIAKRCETPLIFSNQVGGNDDIVYDGANFILDQQGNLLGAATAFQTAVSVFNFTPDHMELISGFSPYTPMSPITLFYEQIILGLKDYAAKCGFGKVVIGISGGIDSALTAALAVKALGAHNVIGLAMPSRYSSDHSLSDAQSLCNNLKITLHIASIEPEFCVALDQFEQVMGEKPFPVTEQNIQARIRGRLLMEYSNQTGALVLSTGNKSELSVGYTTLYGDMTGGFNLIGDLYKTDVYLVAEYFNKQNPDMAIPRPIFDKVPSAELALDQKDTDSLPDYAVLDPILKVYIEGDLHNPQEIKNYHALLETLPQTLIERIHRMVDRAEFKRRQASPIVRVQRRAFGHGRQYPIAAYFPQKINN
jgi:NAD+ synthetase